MNPQIYPAGNEDIDALLNLENICFNEESFHKDQLKYLLLKAKSFVLVASIGDNIVGSIIILLRDHIAQARIYSLNVHPAYRGAGIGGLLVETALKSLKNRGFKKITLEVGINNRVAQNLYTSKGFLLDKVLKNYYKDGDDALHLFMKL